jgi:hypothetical protein
MKEFILREVNTPEIGYTFLLISANIFAVSLLNKTCDCHGDN